jgi:hypothetical protein
MGMIRSRFFLRSIVWQGQEINISIVPFETGYEKKGSDNDRSKK